jgi:hypothetical protein
VIVLEPNALPNKLGGEVVSVLFPNGEEVPVKPEGMPLSFDAGLGVPNPKNGEPVLEEGLGEKRGLAEELALGALNALLFPESPSGDDARLLNDESGGRLEPKTDFTGAGGEEDSAGGIEKLKAGGAGGAEVDVGPADEEENEKPGLAGVEVPDLGRKPGPVTDDVLVFDEIALKPAKPVEGTGGGVDVVGEFSLWVNMAVVPFFGAIVSFACTAFSSNSFCTAMRRSLYRSRRFDTSEKGSWSMAADTAERNDTLRPRRDV